MHSAILADHLDHEDALVLVGSELALRNAPLHSRRSNKSRERPAHIRRVHSEANAENWLNLHM